MLIQYSLLDFPLYVNEFSVARPVAILGLCQHLVCSYLRDTSGFDRILILHRKGSSRITMGSCRINIIIHNFETDLCLHVKPIASTDVSFVRVRGPNHQPLFKRNMQKMKV